MKTFAVTVQVDARIVVTDDFIAALRVAAQGNPADLVNPKPDAFLAAMNEHHADDEDFVKAVLANGMRKMTRLSLVDNLHHSGVSASVAPATVAYTEIPVVEQSVAERAEKTEVAQQVSALAEVVVPLHSDEEVAALVADAPEINPQRHPPKPRRNPLEQSH